MAYRAIIFILISSTTACALPFTPNFCIAFEIWFLTVFSLIFKIFAISLVVLLEINKLNTEIKNLKSGKTLQDKDKIIENQKLIIREKDKTIEYQNNIIESLKQELSNIKEMATTLLHNVKGLATDLYKALKRTLGLDVDKNQKYDYSAFKDLSKKINKKYEWDKSDDFEL